MRRTQAAAAMALLAGAALALSGCSGGSGGGSDNGASQNVSTGDPSQLAISQPYHRPKVPDAGAVTAAVDEVMTDYIYTLGSTDNVADYYIDNLMQPSAFLAIDVNGVTKLQVDGDLLDSVKVVSTSPQTIQYNINPKAVWSDGAPVDCSDFYLQWLATEKNSGDVATDFNSGLVGFQQMKPPVCSNNGKTVTTTYNTPFADWQNEFSSMVPAHVLEKATGVPDVTKLDQNNQADHDQLIKVANFYSGSNGVTGFPGLHLQYDLSAGPFMLKSADGKSETVLVRNPKWWGNPSGPATLDVKTNTDDQSAFQQLQNKEIQAYGGQPDATVADQVKHAGPPFKFTTGIGNEWEHLDYNLKNAVFKAHPELKAALSQCVNRSDIISKVIADVDSNVKPLGNALFLPTESGYQDHYANTGHGDENAAKQTLQSKGWTMGSDGYFHNGSQTASVTIGHKTNDRRESTVKAIQAECKAAGIQVTDYSSDSFNDKDAPAGNYQVALFAWTGSPFKGPYEAQYVTGGQFNWQGLSDPTIDKLFPQANSTLDYATRVKLYNQVDQQMANDVSTLPLYPLPEFAISDGSVVSTSQQGQKVDLQDNEAGSGILWDAYAWQKANGS